MSKRLRLDKLLSSMGHGSRAEIRRAVKAGLVSVNDAVEKDSGRIVDPEADKIAYDGVVVEYKDKIYLLLNKPQGVVSATEDSRDRTVIDLLEHSDRVLAPFPVGRLDKDTEGLLLITNDGGLAHDLLSPRKHVPKTYYAHVQGESEVGEAEKQLFAAGVTLDDGYRTLPAELELLGVTPSPPDAEEGLIISAIRLTIHEGKFHQVKRMFQATGRKVIYLQRLSMGPLQLDGSLGLGEYRPLTPEELELLMEASPKAGGKK